MSAEIIANALSGRKTGTCWMALCPAHHDRQPSLSIRDGNQGRVLVRCHAGCDQRDVIAILKKRGLWACNERLPHHGACRHRAAVAEPDRQDAQRTTAALRVWQSAIPADNTPVAAYMATRGLTLHLPSSLRCHQGLRHPSGEVWPCMVALVTRGRDGTPIAIHRTFLARDGGGKAPVDPTRMMFGPCRGGAVRLAQAGDVLMVGEGIETCLSAMQATGHPAWAALSTSGLRALDLPDAVREVIVLADGDDPGEAAARDCALRWRGQGRHVRIARPPRGMDFNDVLLGRVRHVEGAGQ